MARRRGKHSIYPPINAPGPEAPTGIFKSPQKMDPGKPDSLLRYAIGPGTAEAPHHAGSSAASLRHQECKGLRDKAGHA